MTYGQAMAEMGRIRVQFDALRNVAHQMDKKAKDLANAGQSLKQAKDKVCGSEWIGIDADAFSNKVDGLVGDAGRPGSVLYHAEALQQAAKSLKDGADAHEQAQIDQVKKMMNGM